MEYKNISIQRLGTLGSFTSYVKKKQTKEVSVVCKGIQLKDGQRGLSGYFHWGQNEVVIHDDLLRKGMIVYLLERPGLEREAEQSRLPMHVVHRTCGTLESIWNCK